ncbi:MAG: hypothetical protein JO332_13450 [Planctomycetaceae bacterium]|nr:hypothetical protein [Planctomycetaceae bacterium]
MTILVAVVLALAQGDPSLEARVSAYAAQLREDGTRDRARDRLIHLGKSALPFLEKVDADPTVLASIRQEIALNDSLGTSYGPPHLFSFDGSEESLGVLLSRLESTAGAPFQKNSLDLGQKLSIKLEDATFWEALDEICAKASIWYYPTNDPLYLNGGMASLKPRSYYGPIMAVMDRVIQQRRVNFSTIESDFTIRLMLVWEKSIAPLGTSGRYHLAAVTDDTGAMLIAPPRPAPPAPRPGGLIRPPGQGLDLSGLRPPSPGAKKLSRVEGTLELEFPFRLDEVRFELSADGPTPSKERAIEGAKIELKNFTPQAAWGATMSISIKFDDPKEAAAFRIGPTDIDYVLGSDQKRSGWIGSAKLEDGATYTFVGNWRNGGRQELPKEVRLRIPRGVVIKNVPFSFKDVELK